MKNKRAWLKAIQTMRNYYLKIHDDIWCPFCDIAHNRCELCLWMLFQGTECEDYAERYFGHSIIVLKSSRNPAWIKSSLKRLARWEKRIKSENP